MPASIWLAHIGFGVAVSMGQPLARREPGLLFRGLGQAIMWHVEAGKYNVLPIDSSDTLRFLTERPQVAMPRDRYIYWPDTQSVPYFAGPKAVNRPHAITADVDIPAGGAEGLVVPGFEHGLLVVRLVSAYVGSQSWELRLYAGRSGRVIPLG